MPNIIKYKDLPCTILEEIVPSIYFKCLVGEQIGYLFKPFIRTLQDIVLSFQELQDYIFSYFDQFHSNRNMKFDTLVQHLQTLELQKNFEILTYNDSFKYSIIVKIYINNGMQRIFLFSKEYECY